MNIVITGATRGIGKALADIFIKRGDNVFGTGTFVNNERPYTGLRLFELDLRSSEKIQSCVEEIKKSINNIDILINNAGVLLDEEDIVLDSEKLGKTLQINLIGTVEWTELLIPLMKKGSKIINISSTAGSLALVDKGMSHYPLHYPAYKISKVGLNMYTRTLAERLRSNGIIVASMHPGWVRTAMGGDTAPLSPEEAAQGIVEHIVKNFETGQFWYRDQKLEW